MHPSHAIPGTGLGQLIVRAGPKAGALEVGWTVGASPRFTRLPWVIYLWLNGLPAGKFVWLQHKPVNPLPSVPICR